MRKKFNGWWILLALVVGLAAGYLLGSFKARAPGDGTVSQKIAPEPQPAPQKIAPESQPSPQTEASENTQEPMRPSAPTPSPDPYKGLSRDEVCTKVGRDVADFFEYVSTKDYFKHLAGDGKAAERFKAILDRLSAKPPIPGGEGIDSSIIIDNIYYLFRTLKKEDLRLIKAFLANEADGLELDLLLLHKWLFLEGCKADTIPRPSFDLLYQMSGFFLNTIGGRAYLARRPPQIKALATYYCLLILHEANKRGRNSYGIDILPHIASLKEELGFTKDLALAEEYRRELALIEKNYTHRQ